jgi:thiol:disulfide interchange protein DsbD
MKQRYTVLLGAALLAVAASAFAAESLQSKLRDIVAPSALAEPEVPDPEQVYRFSARPLDASVLLRVDIDDCCYLYRDKLRITLVGSGGKPAPAGARLGGFSLPPGKVKLDEFVGKTEVYTQPFDVQLPVELGRAKTSELALKIDYQGCSERPVAVCYAPMSKLVSLTGEATTPAFPAGHFGAGFWFALAAAFGAGVLLTFTPCVLPMIPILSGVIVGAEGKYVTKRRGGLLSYTYVFGTAVTYTVAGAIAGATGEQLQAHFQNMWAIGIFSAVLVLLALSMFGFYELQVPSAIQSLLHRQSSKLRGRAKQWVAGEYVGVFLLGVISALIIGACVSPVLVSVLGGAIAARDPWLGAGVMFMLAHGQGLILVALGVSEGALLPKAGQWMNTVKHVFGVLLIAVAIYLLGYLPQVPVLLLWGVLFIVCAVYLGATQRLPENAGGWRYLWKGLGTVLLLWGLLALLGGFAGNRDIFNPLPLSLLRGAAAPPIEPAFERVTTMKALERRLADAKAAGKPVLLDYYADWCTDCIRMEKATFADSGVRAELKRFVTLQADVTNADDPEVKALKNRFGVYGPPATLFFSASGEEHREMRAYGFIERDDFLSLLRRIN